MLDQKGAISVMKTSIPYKNVGWMENKTNIHSIYHMQTVNHNVDQGNGNDYKGWVLKGYKGRGGYRGGRGKIGKGHGQGYYYFFNCWKEDHISHDFPIKDKTNLKFYNICGVGDHSLEYYPITLEKVTNKRNVNLLQTIPKKEILNSKNFHVISWSGAGEGIYPNLPSWQKGYINTYLDPEHDEKLM